MLSNAWHHRVEFRNKHDTMESNSAISMTPWSRIPQYAWHVRVRIPQCVWHIRFRIPQYPWHHKVKFRNMYIWHVRVRILQYAWHIRFRILQYAWHIRFGYKGLLFRAYCTRCAVCVDCCIQLWFFCLKGEQKHFDKNWKNSLTVWRKTRREDNLYYTAKQEHSNLLFLNILYRALLLFLLRSCNNALLMSGIVMYSFIILSNVLWFVNKFITENLQTISVLDLQLCTV